MNRLFTQTNKEKASKKTLSDLKKEKGADQNTLELLRYFARVYSATQHGKNNSISYLVH